MRHSCLFATVSLALLTLSGCRMESTGSSAFNPATNVDLTFSSFRLTERPDLMLVNDFVRAVEPASASPNEIDIEQIAESIREQIGFFFGLQYSENLSSEVLSAKNPLDLMRRVIGENQVQNFQDGREYIVGRIIDRAAGEYNNKTNQAQIRFTDYSAFLEGAAVKDQQWRYPVVKWGYTPDSTNLIIRIIIWAASGEFPEGSTRPSATLGTEFSPRDFKSVGYNDLARIRTEGSIVIEGEREMSFVRQYQGFNTDTFVIDGTEIGTNNNTSGGPPFEFANEQIDCLKIIMDYETPMVSLFMSYKEIPGTENYCSEKSAPDLTYATLQTGLRP